MLCVLGEVLSFSPALFGFSPKSFPCWNNSGLFHLGGFPPESGEFSMSIIISRSKIWFMGLLWGVWAGLVRWQISLMETRWWDSWALFRSGIPNGILCSSFLCSQSVSLSLFYKDTNSIYEAHSYNQAPSRPHLQIPSYWGLEFNICFWGTQPFSP